MLKFDQHFLNEKNIINETIREAKINNEDIIIEIGPGKGILTKAILEKKPKKLISIEIDEKFKEDLSKIKDENFELQIGNALEIIDKYHFTKIIANIPYSITEPLYVKILEMKVQLIIILHGLTFYKKITDNSRKLHHFISSTHKITLIREVTGDSFKPKTKVTSALVKLELRNILTKKEKIYSELFQKRNRTTINALTFSLVDVLGCPKKEAKQQVISSLYLHSILDKKIELLSNKEFILVTEFINKTIEN